MSEQQITAKQSIFRYKLSHEIENLLLDFSKKHENSDRKEFKSAWKRWCEKNEILLSNEKRRLTLLNYSGNIEEKMYKSARYYFRKKEVNNNNNNNNEEEDEVPEGLKRSKYVSVRKEILESMDKHIKESIQKSEENNYRPAVSYEEYCKIYNDLLEEEKKLLLEQDMKIVSEQQNKLKKTYKNRYYLIMKTTKTTITNPEM